MVISLRIYLNFAESILILADLLLLTIRSQRTIVLFGYTHGVLVSLPGSYEGVAKERTDVFLCRVVDLKVEVDLFSVVSE